MKELDDELWKLGVAAKTKHNEVAPAQHELAPIFSTTNIAVDHNQLTMEMMKRVATRHGMACLLHEKPFDGANEPVGLKVCTFGIFSKFSFYAVLILIFGNATDYIVT